MTRILCLACIAFLTSCTPKEDTGWIERHAHVLSLEPESYDDLTFLKPLLKDKRIVQLGENTHGIREYNILKDRLIRYLHKELDFRVLVFESDFYQCHRANERAAMETAARTLTGCAYGTWHTTGVLPLFEYLQASQSSDQPLRLAGLDIQPIGNNKDDRPTFLSEAAAMQDAMYARQVFSLDSTFLAIYSTGSRARRAYLRKAEGKKMLEAYDQLVTFLDETAADLSSDSDRTQRMQVLVARQSAESIAWYIRQQTAPTTEKYVENRDQGMARNLRFLVDILYPDEKVIVWGHNFHIRHDNAAIPADSTMFPDVAVQTMGHWIHEWYGDEVYTVGFYAYEGSSADNSGESFDVTPATPGSLEALLHETGAGTLFVDLSQASDMKDAAWMTAPITARYNGVTPLTMRLRDQYDGLLFVDQITLREMMY